MGRKGNFIKSVFVPQDNFNNSDHMDSDGGFNCGRPSGYIKDWQALPEATRRLISSVKRVRALFGIVSSNEVTNEKGEPANSPINIPVIWEINNKDAFNENPYQDIVGYGLLGMKRHNSMIDKDLGK